MNNKGIELVGQIYKIGDIQQVTDKFQKRDLILYIENERNPQYSDHLKLQLTQDRCDYLEKFATGEMVKVLIDITGRLFTNRKTGEEDCFPNLSVYQIDAIAADSPVPEQPAPAPAPEAPKGMPEATDAEKKVEDLPF